MVEARQILALVEELAPARLAAREDNIGLMIGQAGARVNKVALALDPTPATLRQARQAGAQLLLTHHPLFFRPLERLDLDEPTAATAALALELGLTLVSAHTNLDAAPHGVSWALARRLGLADLKVLEPVPGPDRYKLVVFVPVGYEPEVRAALFEAGAGRIGAYTGCSFAARGEGTFTPGAESQPFLGRAGRTETAAESRVEVLVQAPDLERVTRALKATHPYEEVAYDLYPLARERGPAGLGCLGRYDPPLEFRALVELVKEKLALRSVRVAARPSGPVGAVAVLGGSGGRFVGRARACGAQVFISGDFGYHQAREAEALGLGLIDAGHFATERPVLDEWVPRLRSAAQARGWEVEFEVLAGEEDPWLVMEG